MAPRISWQRPAYTAPPNGCIGYHGGYRRSCTRNCNGCFILTVCLGVTSAVANIYGCDNGRIGPTRCAVIDGVLGDRWSRGRVGRTPRTAAGSARSALAVALRLACTAALGGSPQPRTRPRSGSTPWDDASPPRSAPG